MARAVAIVLALFSSGCIPIYLPYTHDYGRLCALEGDALCEVRERETGWYKDYLLAPCPKMETLSSRTTIYKRTYNLSERGSAPVDSAKVDVELGGAEAESLRRVGYAPSDRADGDDDGDGNALLRWDGPGDLWYLAYGPGGVRVYCPRAGVGRGRPLALAASNGYSPVWDPARRRVAFVESDEIHADPPTAVTVWDYAADRVTTHRLRRP